MSDINSKTCFQEVAASTKGVWPTLVGSNPEHCTCSLLIFEATQEAFLQHGMLQEIELPKPGPGCKTSTSRVDPNYKRTYRMSDGRVRLTIAAHLVRRQDAGFLDFLARTVGQAVVSMAAGSIPLTES